MGQEASRKPTAGALPAPRPSKGGLGRPSAGLHCAAPRTGPSGTREGHINALLNERRRVHANKIHTALSAFF